MTDKSRWEHETALTGRRRATYTEGTRKCRRVRNTVRKDETKEEWGGGGLRGRIRG